MLAFEFICHDQAGLTLSGVTDGGMCLWKEHRDGQRANAEAHIAYFQENGHYWGQIDDYAPYEGN